MCRCCQSLAIIITIIADVVVVTSSVVVEEYVRERQNLDRCEFAEIRFVVRVCAIVRRVDVSVCTFFPITVVDVGNDAAVVVVVVVVKSVVGLLVTTV